MMESKLIKRLTCWKHNPSRGSGGILPEEIFRNTNINYAFWYTLRRKSGLQNKTFFSSLTHPRPTRNGWVATHQLRTTGLANQTACLCVRGGRFMWLVVGWASDTPAGKLQRTLPCGRCLTVKLHLALFCHQKTVQDPVFLMHFIRQGSCSTS